ncbi:MAG: UbiA family prenyltransferase [Actinobacteria bacterium]|nr:UbiA family prenyltransferase [Actinomycetota bacterium]
MGEQQMITRIRLVLLLARPAVIVLLMMFAATGVAQTGLAAEPMNLVRVLVTVTAFLLFSVAWNDLADEAIDRVNLPGQRPLTAGVATRSELVVIGLVSGAIALAVGTTLGWPVLVVTCAGLALSAGYSLRPVRLAERGAVASMVLPACYVAVPYLIGLLTGGHRVTAGDLALAGGLYLGFIGRILLKDFRDVRGDALFGKRTFLILHGRRVTCALSSGCFVAGSAALVAVVQHLTALLAAEEGILMAAVLVALRLLAAGPTPRREEALISAIAILGRGMVLLVLAHLSMVSAQWPLLAYMAVLVLLGLGTLGQAARMVRLGPVTRLTVPDWVAAGSGSRAAAGTAEKSSARLP